ncbi:MAG TPA: alpha-L-rhamnosidase C-terminal domain-containing protein [Bryobacteraceae bacterium]|nr:alpha-L-rhamnosidase C-terminal domain-containing protein [Bryobacteraceae bacterium]
MRTARVVASVFLFVLPSYLAVAAGHLDPSRDVTKPELESSIHKPLPEQYIWTRGDAAALQRDHARYANAEPNVKAEPHYFRYAFHLDTVPPQATLYIAGPRSAKIYLNGKQVDDVTSDVSSILAKHVFITDVSHVLYTGRNVIALQVVRGRGVLGMSNSRIVEQEAFGEVLVAKIVPRAPGIDAPALMISGPDWKSSTHAATGWEKPDFRDGEWQPVQSLGPIESSIEMFQWNLDDGMYDWPGYDGISPFLAHDRLLPQSVSHVFEGRSRFQNLQALTRPASSAARFTVKLAAQLLPEQEAPSLLLDFGREIAGRLEVVSASDSTTTLSIEYGESDSEALNGPYLGNNLLRVAPHATAYGPKTAFRYARVYFLGGGSAMPFASIRADAIYYPVEYRGSFESSDTLLNRIWETGAYSAHLCMQDDIWDAPKRDRGRWMGDIDVSGRVISSVFADHFLMEDSIDRLIGPAPVEAHVNDIPGYSAMWVTGLTDYYRHSGSRAFLEKVHPRLVQLLNLMDREFDQKNLFANRLKAWLFVDWSADLYSDTPEARRGTELEFYLAFRQGADLLRALGDTATAAHFETRAQAIKAASQQLLLDHSTGTFGPRWQTNAMAVLSGVADESQYPTLWNRVLSGVGGNQLGTLSITPYYNYYVITAMARMGHRAAALNWLRRYWGGMLDEGATSFWEAYDLSWPKKNYHTSLQADGTSGYFVSLAHGWSSGPTAWLMEQVLGIQPEAGGFSQVTIRPDLLGLRWARGSEPTPHGPIRIDLKQSGGLITTLDLPQGVEAAVLAPVSRAGAAAMVNGKRQAGQAVENGSRVRLTLRGPGHYEIRSER